MGLPWKNDLEAMDESPRELGTAKKRTKIAMGDRERGAMVHESLLDDVPPKSFLQENNDPLRGFQVAENLLHDVQPCLRLCWQQLKFA